MNYGAQECPDCQAIAGALQTAREGLGFTGSGPKPLHPKLTLGLVKDG